MREREEAKQEAQALAIYNNKKAQYYKSAKLIPGAVPGHTLALSLTRLDSYRTHERRNQCQTLCYGGIQTGQHLHTH